MVRDIFPTALSALTTVFALAGLGCSDKEPENKLPDASYALSSMVFGPEDSTLYVSLLSTLGEQTVDFATAHEFGGLGDIWVHEGSMFVLESSAFKITRYAVDALDQPTGTLNFSDYGLSDFGFWVNVFVSPTKAYLIHGAIEYIAWNPSTMEITGTIPLPELADRGALRAFPGYSDRSAQIRDGKLYQPFYWTDDTFFQFDPSSALVVFDLENDRLDRVIDAPCPGLDFSAQDQSKDLYFSSWVFAPPGAALLNQPATCVVRVAAGSTVAESLFTVADVAGGRQGGAFRYLGDNRALFSVLHPEHSTSSEVETVAYGPNWKLWTYDLATGAVAELETIDWNAGAAYSATAGGVQYLMIPAGDYSATVIHQIENGRPERRFESRGWSVRLFDLR